MKRTFKIPVAILGALAVLALAAPSAAQTPTGFEEAQQSSRRLPFLNEIPFGGVATIESLTRQWTVNTFYIIRSGASSSPFWVMRRQMREPFSGRLHLRWADSRSCPAVEKVLMAMEDLPLVRPDAPRLGREFNIPGRGPDGVDHVFWNRDARSGPRDAGVSLEIEGSSESPVALWWDDASAQLAKCWTEIPPAL